MRCQRSRPLTNEHRVRTTECPICPNATSSHLIVLWLWLCSLKQRTQFNSRLISVTASPQLHLPPPSPLPLMPHLSQLCPSCLTCLTTPSCLTCAEFPLHYFAGLSKDAQWIPDRAQCLYSHAFHPPLPSISLSASLCCQVERTALFYLHTFGINWSSLYRVSFLIPFPSFPHGAEQHTHKAALSYFQSIKIT